MESITWAEVNEVAPKLSKDAALQHQKEVRKKNKEEKEKKKKAEAKQAKKEAKKGQQKPAPPPRPAGGDLI